MVLSRCSCPNPRRRLAAMTLGVFLLAGQSFAAAQDVPQLTAGHLGDGEGPNIDGRVDEADGGVRHQPMTAADPPAPKPDAVVATPFSTIQNQEDAPPCSTCGAIMIRSGACYKCVNCGNTSGCA